MFFGNNAFVGFADIKKLVVNFLGDLRILDFVLDIFVVLAYAVGKHSVIVGGVGFKHIFGAHCQSGVMAAGGNRRCDAAVLEKIRENEIPFVKSIDHCYQNAFSAGFRNDLFRLRIVFVRDDCQAAVCQICRFTAGDT